MIQIFSEYFKVKKHKEDYFKLFCHNLGLRYDNNQNNYFCFSGFHEGWLTTLFIDNSTINYLELRDKYPYDNKGDIEIEVEFTEVLSRLIEDSVHWIEVDLGTMKGFSTKLFSHGEQKFHKINLSFTYEGIVNE